MTKDIQLIELTEDKLDIVRNWRNSKDVAQYMYTEDYISEEQQLNWFKRIVNDPSQKYWIINYNGKDLGLASLYSLKPQFKTCYWAFYLGDTSVRGAGIGAKVEYSVLQYVFETLRLNKLLCEVFVTNDAVIKMHEKFGFRREGYFRQHIYKNNEFLDVVSLAMLKAEWDVVKTALKEKIYR
jgi:UDP-4-amino-4,6-dideoxy-N-acetyl-beta-L-altrosamine N-acetyltransferase